MPSEPGGTPAANNYFNGSRSPSLPDEGIPLYLYLVQDGSHPWACPGHGRVPRDEDQGLEKHSTLMEEFRVLHAEECALRHGKDEALLSCVWRSGGSPFLFLFATTAMTPASRCMFVTRDDAMHMCYAGFIEMMGMMMLKTYRNCDPLVVCCEKTRHTKTTNGKPRARSE